MIEVDSGQGHHGTVLFGQQHTTVEDNFTEPGCGPSPIDGKYRGPVASGRRHFPKQAAERFQIANARCSDPQWLVGEFIHGCRLRRCLQPDVTRKGWPV